MRLTNRINGTLNRLRHEYRMWRHRQEDSRADRLFQQWIRQLCDARVQVLLGGNFAEYGGVQGHLKAIQRNSEMKVELGPPDELIKKITLYQCQLRIGSLLRDFDASVMHAVHSHVFPLFTDWCFLQQQQFGTFWIHTYHLNYYPEHCRGDLEPWMLQINESLLKTACHADAKISVSRWQQAELRDQHGIDTIYIPNGVDVARCQLCSAARFRNAHALDHFVLYVGRDDPVKNPEEFVHLALRMPEIPCVMIGGGLNPDRIAELCGSVPKNLHILGPKSAAEVHDALAAASVVVVTSKREGLPTLVLEAMVHETPLVVPDEAGCLEALNQGQYGSIYRLGDLEDLQKKVTAALSRKRTPYGGLRHVCENYDWQTVMPQLDEVYRRREKQS
ncbi:MAG: glycosyltransferase family 4 protein [Planctomycetia bacterium]